MALATATKPKRASNGRFVAKAKPQPKTAGALPIEWFLAVSPFATLPNRKVLHDLAVDFGSVPRTSAAFIPVTGLKNGDVLMVVGGSLVSQPHDPKHMQFFSASLIEAMCKGQTPYLQLIGDVVYGPGIAVRAIWQDNKAKGAIVRTPTFKGA